MFLTEELILHRIRCAVLNNLTMLRHSRSATDNKISVYFCDSILYSVFKLFCFLQ
jgi:hypothetical protein